MTHRIGWALYAAKAQHLARVGMAPQEGTLAAAQGQQPAVHTFRGCTWMCIRTVMLVPMH